MKKYLLPKDGEFYKANLHVHTNISDGQMSPEEIKKVYKEKGYSVVAFTDHEVMVPHNDLTADDFLAITSTEIIVNKRYDCDFNFTKCYHLNIYSSDANKNIFSTFSEKEMWLEKSLNYIPKEQRDIKYKRYYSIESVNEMIAMANSEDCLVSYNHPVWSLQDYSDYIGLKGLWGVEWSNTGCVRNGYVDSIKPIDDLLRVGQNVFPLATDDAHSIYDCFGGFVMIKANKLNYKMIFDALKNGDFYSSQKPLIHELYIEDGVVNIKTSKAKKIYISTDKRYTFYKQANEGEYLTEAQLDINHYLNNCDSNIAPFEYIMVSVIDEEGFIAHTRAYYLSELK